MAQLVKVGVLHGFVCGADAVWVDCAAERKGAKMGGGGDRRVGSRVHPATRTPHRFPGLRGVRQCNNDIDATSTGVAQNHSGLKEGRSAQRRLNLRVGVQTRTADSRLRSSAENRGQHADVDATTAQGTDQRRSVATQKGDERWRAMHNLPRLADTNAPQCASRACTGARQRHGKAKLSFQERIMVVLISCGKIKFLFGI